MKKPGTYPQKESSTQGAQRLGLLGTLDNQQGEVLLVGSKLEDRVLDRWQVSYQGRNLGPENVGDFVLCVMGSSWRT